MKTILLIFIISTTITWARAQSFVVNKDTIHIYAGGKIWKTSYDNGSTWSINFEFIYGDNAINFTPICKDNYVYYQSDRTRSLMVSSDYGKTFQESKIDTGNGIGGKSTQNMYISQIKFDGDEMYIATIQGLYISYDKGYILHYKDKPGQIDVFDPSDIYDFIAELNGMVIVDTSLILTSRMTDGGLFRTQTYNKNDSNKTIFYPVSKDYFITKYGRNSYFWDVYSYSITKVKDKIYTIFAKRNNTDEYSRVWTLNTDGTNLEEQDYSAFGIENPTWIGSCGDILYLYDKGVNIDIVYNGKKLYMSDDEGQTWKYIRTGFDLQTGAEVEFSSISGDMQFNGNYAFFQTKQGLLRAPLKDCKITSGATSVESKEEQEITIFPNPVKDIIKLNTNTPLKLELYDIFGNKVLEDTNTQLNVQHLNIGTYYLKYGNETKLIIKY